MPAWRKSTYSGGQGSCVEVADPHADEISVRDTKQTGRSDRVTLTVTAAAWRSFTAAVKTP